MLNMNSEAIWKRPHINLCVCSIIKCIYQSLAKPFMHHIQKPVDNKRIPPMGKNLLSTKFMASS
jgi:hypothetical protein